ncbi:LLM class flavin-dependent oxidoreductase [soil metagenome]
MHSHVIAVQDNLGDTMAKQLEFGLDTFGDVTNAANGEPVPYAQVLRNLVAQGVLADQVGLDYIGVGEHHRKDFAVSAPEVVLAAIAAKTENIHVGTAVTVLSSDDPIRVFQRFATLDGISNGRAEVILGRGSFTESFPLFGFELNRYEELFEEKLELFAAVRQQQPVNWTGTIRPPVVNQNVFPVVENGLLKAWIGVGGSPESGVRTARYGFNRMLAIIGGAPERFAPYVDLFHRALAQFGQPTPLIGVHSPGHIAETDEQAREELWPHHSEMTNRIGKERGWGPMSRESFNDEADHGSLYVGSVETVAQKIAKTAEVLGLDRFDLKYSNGTLAHEKMMSSIELYGTQVVPRVRELLAE